MKKILFALVVYISVITLAFTASAATYSGTCGADGDNLTWTLDTDIGVLEITGEGDMEGYKYVSDIPWYNYRSNIKSVSIGDGVTSIADLAFYDCASITSMTIPVGVTSIGKDCFVGCYSLASVFVDKGNLYYSSDEYGVLFNKDKTTLIKCPVELSCKEYEIPDGVTTISAWAFSECENLAYITFPDSLKTIEEGAFDRCTYLSAVELPKALESIGIYAFASCESLKSIHIPYNVTKIEECTFNGCSSLSSVTMEKGVTTIGIYAFSGCKSLSSVTIGSGVTTIGNGAFNSCSSLKSIDIPKGVTSIGWEAFYYCTSLSSVTIPDTVTSIGEDAFYSCKDLVIYGDKGSYAEEYATTNKIPFNREIVTCEHVFEWVVQSVATCTTDGYEVYQCNKCFEVWDSKTISALGHDEGWVVVSAATCTLGGYERYECKRCFKVFGSKTTSAFGHSGDWIVTVVPTTESEGEEYRVCSTCGITETRVLERISMHAGSCGNNLRWAIYSNGELVISGTGPMYNFAPDNLQYYFTWHEFKEKITSVTILDGVSTIGDYAFYGCELITSITVPESVTSIGNHAFIGLWQLTSIAIPNAVTSIGEYAFLGCQSLSSIVIPASVTSIGYGAFSNCYSMDGRLEIDENNLYYSSDGYGVLFNKDKTKLIQCFNAPLSYEIPYGVTSICDRAFEDFDSLRLESITIPDSVTSIGDRAFKGCDLLTSITIPGSVTSVGGYAFYGCESLVSITISDGVKSMGDYAFAYCTSLVTITIPDSVMSIGDYVFYNCESLKSITIHGTVTNIGIRAFCSCESLTSIMLPESVTTIGVQAFMGCKSLITTAIPSNVTSIGEWAFSGCDSLSSITLPDGVTTIGRYAFDSCESFTDVYYTGTKAEWDAITIGYDNEYLTNATIHYATEHNAETISNSWRGEVSKNKVSFVVHKNLNSPSSDTCKYVVCEEAYAVVSDKYYYADKNGVITIPKDADVVNVFAEEYVGVSILLKKLERNPKIYLERMVGLGPLIKGVVIGNNNILASKYQIDLLSKQSVTLIADVEWTSGAYKSIYLMQESKRVSFDGDTLTTVLSDNFDVSKTIYIVAEDADGNTVKKKLLIEEIGADAFEGWEFNIGDSFSGTLPSDIPVLGGMPIELDVPYIPFDVNFEGNRFYVTLGFDIVKYENSLKNVLGPIKETEKKTSFLYKNIKDAMLKSYDKYTKDGWKKIMDKSLKGKFGFEADFTVIGYMEGYINSSGKPEVILGKMILNPSAKLEFGSPIPVPIPIPLYWEAAIKGEIEGHVNLYTNEAAKNFVPNSGSIGGDITLSGGVGVGVNKLVGLSAGLKGKLGALYNVYATADNYFGIYGAIGAYIKAFVGPLTLVDKTWNFAEGTIFDNPSTKVETLMTLSRDEMADSGNHALIDRSYAENESEFAANYEMPALFSVKPQNKVEKVFKTNAYTYAEPCFAEFSDGTRLAVWLDDNAERSDINRTSVYWSYFDGSEWSAPAELESDGTADFYPSLSVIGDAAYLTFVDTSVMLTDNATLAEVTAAWDVSAAVFANRNFGEVMQITSDGTLDCSPRIFGNGDAVYAAWLSVSDNDIFSDGQTYSIMLSSLADGAWSTAETYASNLYSVDSFDGTVVDGGAVIAYSVYLNGDTGDTSSLELYVANERITENAFVDSKVSFCNGVLYWYQNGNICYYTDGTVNVAFDGITTDRFNIMSDGKNKIIVFAENDELASELYAFVYDSTSDSWSNKIQLTDLDCYIGDFSGAYSADGSLCYLISRTEVVGTTEDENPYGETNLSLFTVAPSYNLSIDYVNYFAETLVSDNVIVLETEITNNGELTVDKYVVEVYANGKLMSSNYSASAILPGETLDFEAYYELGNNFAVHDITLKLTALGCTDFDETDNSYNLTLSYNDVALENVSLGETEDGNAVIYCEVVNRGYETAETMCVSLREDNEGGDVVATLNTSSSLTPLDSEMLAFTVPLENDKVYCLSVDADDDNIADNSAFVVLLTMENIIGDVNDDGALNVADVLFAIKAVLDGTIIEDADIDGNGKITLIDVLRLLKMVAA